MNLIETKRRVIYIIYIILKNICARYTLCIIYIFFIDFNENTCKLYSVRKSKTFFFHMYLITAPLNFPEIWSIPVLKRPGFCFKCK